MATYRERCDGGGIVITVIDLNIIPVQCTICDLEWEEAMSAPSFGIARYEDEVVPDDYQGEWGGSPVCRRCYWIERGLRAETPERFIPFSEIREISKGK